MPELSLTGFKEASGLMLWMVGNMPELMNVGGETPQIIQSNSQCSPEEKLRLQVGKCPAIGHPGEEWQNQEALGIYPLGSADGQGFASGPRVALAGGEWSHS